MFSKIIGNYRKINHTDSATEYAKTKIKNPMYLNFSQIQLKRKQVNQKTGRRKCPRFIIKKIKRFRNYIKEYKTNTGHVEKK